MIYASIGTDGIYLWDQADGILICDEGYGLAIIRGPAAHSWMNKAKLNKRIRLAGSSCKLTPVSHCAACSRPLLYLDYLCGGCRV